MGIGAFHRLARLATIAAAACLAPGAQARPADTAAADAGTTAEIAPTLDALVAAQTFEAQPDSELQCVAIGVYYEARREPLAGQLAVARVIVNRTTSGLFPRSTCDVLKQRNQFSFIHDGKLPVPPENADWRTALAVSQVARRSLWQSDVEGALFFHAAYASPGWKRPRAGRVGNHIFYR